MDLIVRAAVIFFFVFLITRVVGRRELGSAEPFDLILLVVLGDLVQQGITQSDNSVTGAILVISTLSLLTVAVSYLSVRIKRLRPVLDGEPLVLVEDGQPHAQNLKRQRLDLAEVLAEARLQQIARLADIQWAILESSGQISFIPKPR
ncbi:MAG TPA: YetF domain-containing protein [Gaiellales bacterium]|nr:YetF domain-containing protein [Gaiellales bacterium]